MTTPTDPLYISQWHFGLIGDIQKIWDEYNGTGVVVGVYDSGVDLTHEDLAANIVIDPVTDTFANPLDGSVGGGDGHGTSVAGIIAAQANNGLGGAGVAWGAQIASVNVFDPTAFGYINGNLSNFLSLVDQADQFDIMSNSWGSFPVITGDNGLLSGGFTDATNGYYETLSSLGRGGLGTVIVQAAGNDNEDGGGSGLNASRFTITVAATDATGMAATYSNYGASILVTAPAAAVTTDITGADGYDPTNYTTGFGGTSAATPVVSGVVALMLQANAGLGWRDVQNILAMSATLTGSAFDAMSANAAEEGLWQVNGADTWNGGGAHIHTNYGYGMVNAYDAVRMAEVWTLFNTAQTSANEVLVTSGLNDFPDTVVTASTTVPYVATFTIGSDVSIEHVALKLDFATTWASDLKIVLTSAEGTQIVVFTDPDTMAAGDFNGTFQFGIDGLRGEMSAGTWTVEIFDIDIADALTVRAATLDVYGSTASVNDVYHFTDEYLAMRGFDASRATVTDSDGGTDWLNLAAVSGDIDLSLASGATFTVDAVAWATLGSDFENVVTGDGNDTVAGNDVANEVHLMRGDDVFYGGYDFSGTTDTVYGGAGNDTLDGGYWEDELFGGSGDDRFVVTLDSIGGNVDGGSGTDTLDLGGFAALDYGFTVNLLTGSYELLPLTGDPLYIHTIQGVENVIGTAKVDILTGNTQANTLAGGASNDSLNGGGSDDTLQGDAGADTLQGGTGNDSLTGGADSDWYYVDSQNDTVVEGSTEGSADRVLASVTFVLANGIHVEQLSTTLAAGTTAINLTGNTQSQTITGNAGVNVLNGNGGNDTLIGNAGTDTLNGGTGVDSLNGGADNDWYYVDDALDIIVEGVGGGTADRVLASATFVLASDDDIEQLSTTVASGTTAINLTGNNLAQQVTGNAGVNVLNGSGGNDTMSGLAGADTLNGGTGVDSLNGGLDNDWYYVDDALDIIVEGVGGGTADRVLASVTFALASDDDIEQLSTTLAAGTTAINLTGNNLAQTITGNAGINVLNGSGGNDTLIGNAGTDTLQGGTGIDSLNGGADDDWYYVDDALDIIVEGVGGGTADRVLASVTFALAGDDNIEQLSTTLAAGVTAINLTGNNLAQTISGNAGINVLNGSGGNDTLTGGLGADSFEFSTALAGNIDRITDFSVVDDTIRLDDAIFTGLLGGFLAGTAFVANLTGAATDIFQRIIYETDTGALFYDADGSNAGAKVRFATLNTSLAVTEADFFVF